MLAYSAAFTAQASTIEQKLASLEQISGRFTFAVLGDSRSGDAIYKEFVGKIAAGGPAFVVNVGDVIFMPGSLPEWSTFWEMSAAIKFPYFLTVGNHEVGDEKSEEIYKEQVDLPGNELYYSFSCGNSLFIVLDSSVIGEDRRITGEQLAWLKNVLETGDKLHKFVFIHHPLSSGSAVFSERTLESYPEDRDRLRDLLVEHKVDAVFSGHLHLYLRKTFHGLTQIITGGGGAPLIVDEEKGGFFHFVLVTVEGDKVSAEVIDLNGSVRDRFQWRR